MIEREKFQSLTELKQSLFREIEEHKASRQAMRELFNVLDVLQVKRLEEIERLAVLEAERLPIEAVAFT
ncbi:hypothetical protein HZB89_01685 [archaeon]|nr:hypothetical protein [archaeon]